MSRIERVSSKRKGTKKNKERSEIGTGQHLPSFFRLFPCRRLLFCLLPPHGLVQVLPFPLDKVTRAATLVEAFSSDAILKVHCLVSKYETFELFLHIGGAVDFV